MIKHETFPAGQQVPRVRYARPNKANRKMMIVSERFLVSSYLKAGVSFFVFLATSSGLYRQISFLFKYHKAVYRGSWSHALAALPVENLWPAWLLVFRPRAQLALNLILNGCAALSCLARGVQTPCHLVAALCLNSYLSLWHSGRCGVQALAAVAQHGLEGFDFPFPEGLFAVRVAQAELGKPSSHGLEKKKQRLFKVEDFFQNQCESSQYEQVIALWQGA